MDKYFAVYVDAAGLELFAVSNFRTVGSQYSFECVYILAELFVGPIFRKI